MSFNKYQIKIQSKTLSITLKIQQCNTKSVNWSQNDVQELYTLGKQEWEAGDLTLEEKLCIHVLRFDYMQA